LLFIPLKKKPLSYFQNSFRFSRNHSRKTGGQNWQKQFFFILGKAVLEGGKWFSDPPGVVSGIRGGGVQVHQMVTSVLWWFFTYSTPLVKVRMAWGGPIRLWALINFLGCVKYGRGNFLTYYLIFFIFICFLTLLFILIFCFIFFVLFFFIFTLFCFIFVLYILLYVFFIMFYFLIVFYFSFMYLYCFLNLIFLIVLLLFIIFFNCFILINVFIMFFVYQLFI
jgi:hypothetical protein